MGYNLDRYENPRLDLYFSIGEPEDIYRGKLESNIPDIKPIVYKRTECMVNNDYLHINKLYPNPHVNIQVQVTNYCNANCPFCIYHTKTKNTDKVFDPDKLLYMVRGLVKSNIQIPTITFTGGETSFELDVIKYCIDKLIKIAPSTRIKVNTNGTKFKEIIDLPIWQVLLSRHAIDDTENIKIFQGDNLEVENVLNLPTYSDLSSLSKEQLNRLHLSCNLIKGHVDTKEKVLTYINHFGAIGIKDIGFVSLMGVNEYSREHQIDFDDLHLFSPSSDIVNPIIQGRHCKYIKNQKCCCECQVFWVVAPNGNLVEAYTRFARDSKNDEANIVYAIDTWKQGFSGEKIF